MTSLAVPMGPRVLAIDLALNKSGIAAYAPAWHGPQVWTFRVEKATGQEREDRVLAEMTRTVEMLRPEIALIEDLYVPPRISTGWIALTFMHGLVRHYLRSQAPLVVVHNGHIKIYGTGNGGADKAGMILGVVRRYGHLVDIEDDNQADAFTLLALGCAAYGHPLPQAGGRKLPDTHLRALTMVDWPVIAGLKSPAGLPATTRGSGRAKKAAA
jgi:Holliday junction resolvasome RuvABC endonuclease subunit